MELETIDEQQGQFPIEAVEDIKTMAKWMTFIGVTTIIIHILGILGSLTTLSGGNSSAGISIITSGVGVYLGFLIVNKAGFFATYANGRDEASLLAAMKATKLYWMISVFMIIFSVLTSFIK